MPAYREWLCEKCKKTTGALIGKDTPKQVYCLNCGQPVPSIQFSPAYAMMMDAMDSVRKEASDGPAR